MRLKVVLLFAVAGVGLVLSAGPASAIDDSLVQDVGVRVNDIVWDESRDVVYGAVSEFDPILANHIAAIDVGTGAVLRVVSMAHEPTKLAITDDGQYLYVALRSAGLVSRVDLSSFSIDSEFLVGDKDPGDPLEPYDVFALPDEPNAVLVLRGYGPMYSPTEHSAAVFDDGVMRADVAPESFRWITPQTLVVGDDGLVYASQYKKFATLSLDETGLHPLGDEVEFEYNSDFVAFGAGRVFRAGGRVINVTGATPFLERVLEPSCGNESSFGYYRESTGTMFFADFLTGPLCPDHRPGYAFEEFDPNTGERLSRIEVDISTIDPRWVEMFIPVGNETFAIVASGDLRFLRPVGEISGFIHDEYGNTAIRGICAYASPFGEPGVWVNYGITDDTGYFRVPVTAGTYQVAFVDCERFDYSASWYGDGVIEPVIVDSYQTVDASFSLVSTDLTGLFDPNTGRWHMSRPRTNRVYSFYFGNPGDVPFLGDWDCDGVDTPGLYRQSDGLVYLRNSNTQGTADIQFFFGNPGDVPLAGDFNGDGCDTVSIYRPSSSGVFIINKLGSEQHGLGAAENAYLFGNPGDKPFVGDFNADGIDTVGLHRESTGLVYYRNTHTQGSADDQFIFGDPGDKILSGNFEGFWEDTPAIYRPKEKTFFIRHSNSQGNADRAQIWEFAEENWLPFSGVTGLMAL